MLARIGRRAVRAAVAARPSAAPMQLPVKRGMFSLPSSLLITCHSISFTLCYYNHADFTYLINFFSLDRPILPS